MGGKGSLIVYVCALVGFGFAWWALKPLLDSICVDMFTDFAVGMNMSPQELAWWGFVPLLLFVIIVTGLTVRFLRHRQGGSQ